MADLRNTLLQQYEAQILEMQIAHEDSMKKSKQEFEDLVEKAKQEAKEEAGLSFMPVEGMDTLSRGITVLRIVLHPVWKGVYCRWIDFAPLWNKFFHFSVDLFQKGPCMEKKKKEKGVTKVVCLVKRAWLSVQIVILNRME